MHLVLPGLSSYISPLKSLLCIALKLNQQMLETRIKYISKASSKAPSPKASAMAV
jgi:hypothetical protein